MKAILYIVCSSLFAISCLEKSTRPSNILDPKKMAEVLAEVQILEATYNLQYARLDSSKTIMERGFQQIFTRTGVSRENFEASTQYYSLRAEEMIAIQEDVSDLLMAREAEIQTDK
jgi:Domain of unknown function (DUF4296)